MLNFEPLSDRRRIVILRKVLALSLEEISTHKIAKGYQQVK
jgi:hypothetical protein